MRSLYQSLRVSASVGLLLCGFGAALAARATGPEGVWNRDDGLGGVRIAPCGGGARLCGHVVWVRDKNGPAYIGEQVLFDMQKTSADTWSGSAHNPDDGRDYAGTMTLAGNHLLTRGCALGGLICKSVGLSRAKR